MARRVKNFKITLGVGYVANKEGERSFSLGKQVLFSLIIVCCLLGIGEITIRIWAYNFRTSYERYNSSTGRVELIPNIRYTTRDGNEFFINSKGLVGPELDEHPSEGVYRIIAVGDSCTFTLGFWKMAYPAILERLLNAHTSQNTFEVLNAGIEGLNSSFALARIKQELIKYRPSLVTIYIGWNDLMKVNPANLFATERYTFLAEMMEKSYLMKAYNKLMFVYLRPFISSPKIVSDENESSFYDSFVPLKYQENIESMIEILRKNSVRVILFTLPTVVRSGMNYKEIKKKNVFFPYFAGTYSLDKFLSLHRSYNRVIRRMGKKYDLQIVDLDEVFNSYDKDRLFWDTMHPSEKGNILIAESVFNKLKEDIHIAQFFINP